MRTKETQKQDWIKLVNVASCIAVVFLHTNGCFWTFSTERYWFTANIIECVFYFAVPCFFMISGATLMDYRERYTLRTYLEKRTKKTLIPYIVWSAIGILYSVAIGSLSITDVSARFVWDAFIYSKAVSIYWFFPILFGLYLTIPLLTAVRRDARKEVFSMAAMIMFIFGSVIPFVLKIADKQVVWNNALNVQLGGYVFYLLVGYLSQECGLNKRQRLVIYFLGIAGLLMHICGTYYLSINAGEIIQVYKGYLNVPCIMYSLSIFVWCRYNSQKVFNRRIMKAVIDMINPHSLSIYLLQYFIYSTMIRVFDINVFSIVYRLGAPIIILLTATIISKGIKRIPVIRAIMP